MNKLFSNLYIFRNQPNISGTPEDERDFFKWPIVKMMKGTPDILEHDDGSFENRRLISDKTVQTLSVTEV